MDNNITNTMMHIDVIEYDTEHDVIKVDYKDKTAYNDRVNRY